ncbi:uncharacterized protein LOC144069375 isoform X3 [Stigmatopora argus]
MCDLGSFPEALMKCFGKCGCEQSSGESRHYLLLSSDSPSLDSSAELSIVATDELFCITKLSLTLTRAPVEQVNKYLGDLVNLLQDLVVTLVDVTDHSFMFSCCLCQEDFPSLKERYGLQAQFESFPEALMEVFGECGCAQSSSESRYDLVLSSDSPSLDGSAELSIVETDELFCITKLSLTLTRATVEQVNKYVGDLVTLLQVMRDSTVSSSFGSCGRAGNSTCIVAHCYDRGSRSSSDAPARPICMGSDVTTGGGGAAAAGEPGSRRRSPSMATTCKSPCRCPRCLSSWLAVDPDGQFHERVEGPWFLSDRQLLPHLHIQPSWREGGVIKGTLGG